MRTQINILFITAFFSFTYSLSLFSQSACQPESIELPGPLSCFQPSDEEHVIATYPLITVKLNIHFVEDPALASTEQFVPDNSNGVDLNGNDQINDMRIKANGHFADLVENPGLATSHFIGDSRIRFEIYSDISEEPGDAHEGIWYWTESTLPDIEDLPYGDEVIHVFMVKPDGDRTGSADLTDYTINIYGWANHIKINGNDNQFKIARYMMHEVGHIAGLCHSFAADNPCGDIIVLAECDNTTPVNNCGGGSRCPGSNNNVSTNIMAYGIEAPESLTPCQWGIFYRTLAFSEFNFTEVDLCQTSVVSENIVIGSEEHEVWDGVRFISDELIIESGGSLTINCRVFAGPDAVIIVERGAKLTIENGSIERACPDMEWGGIFVEGYNDKEQPDHTVDVENYPDPAVAGVVRLLGAQIRGAGNGAISTSRRTQPWAEEYWGGLIYAENSYFINNRRSLQFLAYELQNKSYFKDCFFIAQTREDIFDVGVTIWGCHNVTFEECSFINFGGAQPNNIQDGEFAIKGTDFGARIINGNYFEGNFYGLRVLNTYPLAEHQFFIGKDLAAYQASYPNDPNTTLDDVPENFFYKENCLLPLRTAHIFVNASNELDRIDISKNYFENAWFGIHFDGPSSYRIKDNEITGDPSSSTLVHLQNTQERFGDVLCNLLSRSTTSGTKMVIVGNNEGLVNKYNRFNGGSSTDIQIAFGDIFTNQGSFSDPARNCFTSTNAINHSIFPGVNSSFNYFVRDLTTGYTVDNCLLTPDDTPYDYVNEEAISQTSDGCDINIPEPRPVPIKESLIALRNELTSLQSQIQAYPQYEDSLTILWYDTYRKKEDTLSALLVHEIGQQDWIESEQLLLEEGDFRSLEWRAGLYIKSKQFSKLDSFLLNEWPQNTVDDIYFKELMTICGRFYQNPSSFSLTSTEESRITQIAESESSRKYYARALSDLLMGISYPIEPIEVDSTKSLSSVPSSNQSQKPIGLVIYPNPANQQLHVDYQNIPFKVDFSIIHSFEQKEILRKINLNKPIIDVSNLTPGVYAITFYSSLGKSSTYKFVIIR